MTPWFLPRSGARRLSLRSWARSLSLRSWARSPSLRGAALGLVLALPGLSACSTTRFHERQKLADHAMVCDADAMLVYLRTKVEAAREGAIGGFGGSSVGGCGCQ